MALKSALKNGRPLYLLGLSDVDLRFLRERGGIITPLESAGEAAADVLVMWRATEQELIEYLRERGHDVAALRSSEGKAPL